jgi:hypothetical protein
MRESLLSQHIQTKGRSGIPAKSFVKDIATTLTVVYGGESVMGPLLGMPPSFVVSGQIPGLYIACQALVEYFPSVPPMSFNTELPWSIVDGFTRAMLLCNLVPAFVITHASPVISTNPWTLIMTSLLLPNAGFFFTNFFSFLNPTPLSVTTPPELQPYGWTTTDIWCAPLITSLYALLTHAQPFWGDMHSLLAELLGIAGYMNEKGLVDGNGRKIVDPVDPETARAACAIILAGMFVTRTVRTFGLQKVGLATKEKTQ